MDDVVHYFWSFVWIMFPILVFGLVWITLWQDSIVFQLDKYVFGEENQCTHYNVANIGCRFIWYSLIYPFILPKIKKASYKIWMFFYFYLMWGFLISSVFFVKEKFELDNYDVAIFIVLAMGIILITSLVCMYKKNTIILMDEFFFGKDKVQYLKWEISSPILGIKVGDPVFGCKYGELISRFWLYGLIYPFVFFKVKKADVKVTFFIQSILFWGLVYWCCSI